MTAWLTLLGAILVSVAGQTLLKAGAAAADFRAQLLARPTLAGLLLYGGAAMLYIVALRRIPLSVALPCTALSYVAALLIGHYGFAEPLAGRQVAAVALICAGVAVLAAPQGETLRERAHHGVMTLAVLAAVSRETPGTRIAL